MALARDRLVLSTDQRLLDTSARKLVVEEFASYPSTATLMRAYGEQERWEGDKKSILLEHFRSDIDYGARGAAPKEFLRLHNKDANLASTRYVSRLLSLSDYASLLLFIWRFVWGFV